MMRLLPEKKGTMYYLLPKNNMKDKIDEDIIYNMVGNKKKEAQAKREHYLRDEQRRSTPIITIGTSSAEVSQQTVFTSWDKHLSFWLKK
jgi:hypothetical protein